MKHLKSCARIKIGPIGVIFIIASHFSDRICKQKRGKKKNLLKLRKCLDLEQEVQSGAHSTRRWRAVSIFEIMVFLFSLPFFILSVFFMREINALSIHNTYLFSTADFATAWSSVTNFSNSKYISYRIC